MQHKSNFAFDPSHFAAGLEKIMKEENPHNISSASNESKEQVPESGTNITSGKNTAIEIQNNTSTTPKEQDNTPEVHKMLKTFLKDFKGYALRYQTDFKDVVDQAFDDNYILARTISFATPVTNVGDVFHSAEGALAGVKFLEESIYLGWPERENKSLLASSFSMMGKDCSFLFSSVSYTGRPRFILATPSLPPDLNKLLYQIIHHPDLSDSLRSFLTSQITTFSDISPRDIGTIGVTVIYPDKSEKKQVLAWSRIKNFLDYLAERDARGGTGELRVKAEDIDLKIQERFDPDIKFFHTFPEKINPNKNFSQARHQHTEVVTLPGQLMAGNTCIVLNHPDSQFTLLSFLDDYELFKSDLERGFLINKKFPIIEVYDGKTNASVEVLSIEKLDKLHEIYMANKDKLPRGIYTHAISSSWLLKHPVFDEETVKDLKNMIKVAFNLDVMLGRKEGEFYTNANRSVVTRDPLDIQLLQLGIDMRTKPQKELEQLIQKQEVFPIYRAQKTPQLFLYDSPYNSSGHDPLAMEKQEKANKAESIRRRAALLKARNLDSASSTIQRGPREWGEERKISKIFNIKEDENSPRNKVFKELHEDTKAQRPSNNYTPSLPPIKEHGEPQR